eukprot:ANDGO_02896.mRNA.1 Uncharacterized protein ML0055
MQTIFPVAGPQSDSPSSSSVRQHAEKILKSIHSSGADVQDVPSLEHICSVCEAVSSAIRQDDMASFRGIVDSAPWILQGDSARQYVLRILCAAAFYDRRRIVGWIELLVSMGVTLDKDDNKGRTVVKMLACRGHFGAASLCVRALLCDPCYEDGGSKKSVLDENLQAYPSRFPNEFREFRELVEEQLRARNPAIDEACDPAVGWPLLSSEGTSLFEHARKLMIDGQFYEARQALGSSHLADAPLAALYKSMAVVLLEPSARDLDFELQFVRNLQLPGCRNTAPSFEDLRNWFFAISLSKLDAAAARQHADAFLAATSSDGLLALLDWERKLLAARMEPPPQRAVQYYKIPQDAVRASPALQKLDDLIGVCSVKRKLVQLFHSIEMSKHTGLTVDQNLHSLFVGNPGTGKTTVARVFATALREIGVLQSSLIVEKSAVDYTTYEGQKNFDTDIQKLLDAKGGVLFIDDAYMLQPKTNYYGTQIANKLLVIAESHRRD